MATVDILPCLPCTVLTAVVEWGHEKTVRKPGRRSGRAGDRARGRGRRGEPVALDGGRTDADPRCPEGRALRARGASARGSARANARRLDAGVLGRARRLDGAP